ncbi:GspE/PulE family protein [Ruegeria halocynthiae]|uniref:GspE/PulE family protein n=1 Tax=Ruegeria halocynthiae TaxID=985054 RepID=UPI0005637B87|nr:GspE/PulE family protein [Ruegeria halocynthiae]
MAYLDTSEFLEWLQDNEKISQTALQRAENASQKTDTPIEKTLLEFGLVDEDDLYQELAKFLDLRFVTEPDFETGLLENLSIPRDFLKRAEVLPVLEDDSAILVATSNPRALETIESVGFHLKLPVQMVITTPTIIKTLLAQSDPASDNKDDVSDFDIERLNALANDGPTIKLVNDIISDAVRMGASDVHIEAGETSAAIRFRVDGRLHSARTVPEGQRASVISRLKVMADLNISEKRRPQDGRAQISVRGSVIDIRMSTLPTQFGESIVLRLLDRSNVSLNWAALGYDQTRIERIERIANMPNGVFLVAGPTGSGKTTTLYTALSGLNSSDRKIVTVEDPIEYTLPGVNQVQVEPAVDMTFARALRAILRQDPDVIMVGEIRDHETAEIAVRAALVGRLVLSTIHTNDSLSAVTRLIDLGIPPYLLSATLRGVLSQRLVRTICATCQGEGCEACANSGAKGRTVVSELLEIDSAVSSAISDGGTKSALVHAARMQRFSTMQEQANELASSGRIDAFELNRVLGTDF